MVCKLLEAAFVPMENISSCALCLWSIGLLGIWSVNPLKLHHRYKTQRISVIIANAFIDMYAKCGVIHEAENRECQQLKSLLAEAEKNLSISDSAARRVRKLEKNEIFTVKLACALIDDIRDLRILVLYSGKVYFLLELRCFCGCCYKVV